MSATEHEEIKHIYVLYKGQSVRTRDDGRILKYSMIGCNSKFEVGSTQCKDRMNSPAPHSGRIGNQHVDW